MTTLLYCRECMYLHKSVLQCAFSGACKNAWAYPFSWANSFAWACPLCLFALVKFSRKCLSQFWQHVLFCRICFPPIALTGLPFTFDCFIHQNGIRDFLIVEKVVSFLLFFPFFSKHYNKFAIFSFLSFCFSSAFVFLLPIFIVSLCSVGCFSWLIYPTFICRRYLPLVSTSLWASV